VIMGKKGGLISHFLYEFPYPIITGMPDLL